MLARGLIAYLCVFFIFPPQGWAQLTRPNAVTEKKPISVAAAVSTLSGGLTPIVVALSGRSLREEFVIEATLASWEIVHFIKTQMSWAVKAHIGEQMRFFRPFLHCPAPYENTPEDILALDERLDKVQKIFSKYLTDNLDQLGDVGALWIDRDLPMVHQMASDSGAECEMGIWPLRSHEKGEWSRPENLAKFQSEISALDGGNQVLRPLFADLIRKIHANQRFTSAEFRNLVEIVGTLRRYRNLIAKHFVSRGINAPSQPPELSLGATVGKRGERILFGKVEKQTESRRIANEILQSAEDRKAHHRFVACKDKQKICGVSAAESVRGGQDYCFCDGKPESLGLLNDAVLIQMYAPNPDKPGEPHYGGTMEAVRIAASTAQVLEYAAVKDQLPKEDADLLTLPKVCREDPALAEAVSTFDYLNKVAPRAHWIKIFGEEVTRLVKAYRNGEEALKLPHSSSFYQTAQLQGQRWVGDTFSALVKSRKGIAEKNDLRALRDEIFTEMREIPFENLIQGGDRVAGQDFAQIIGQRLMTWFLLVQQSLGNLDEGGWARKKTVLLEMIQEVLVSAFRQGLRDWVFSFLEGRELPFDVSQGSDPLMEKAGFLWGDQFEQKWDRYLKQGSHQGVIRQMARSILDALLSSPRLQEKYDSFKQVSQTVDRRVAQLMPAAEQAVRADQTMRYMESHLQRIRGPENLLPGSNWLTGKNYNSQERKVTDTSSGPAPFQVPDGLGREHQYPMMDFDPFKPQDHLALQKGMATLLDRHQERLQQKLASNTDDHRAYLDKDLRETFVQEIEKPGGKKALVGLGDVRTMSLVLLNRFKKALLADPESDPAVRAQLHQTAFEPLKDWLVSYSAESYLKAKRINLAKSLYEKHLKRWLEHKETPVTKEWETQVKGLLEEIAIRETHFDHTPPSIAELVSLYDRYQSRMSELKAFEGELKKSIAKTLQSGIFDTKKQDPSKWVAFCTKDFGKCSKWIEDLATPYNNKKLLRAFWEARLIRWTELHAKQFLRLFGSKGKVYEGLGKVTQPAIRSRIEFLQQMILRQGWLGMFPKENFEPRAWDRKALDLDEFLISISRHAHSSRYKALSADGLLKRLRGELIQTAEKYGLYEAWKQRILDRVGVLQRAIESKNRPSLHRLFEDVGTLFNNEYTYLSTGAAQTVKDWESDRFYKKLALYLLPELSQIRRTTLQLIKDVSNPVEDPHQEIRSIIEKQWNLNGAEYDAKRRDKDNKYLRVDRAHQAAHLHHLLERARARLRDYLKLQNILQTYVGTLPETKEVIRTLAKSSTAFIWQAFHEDQFLKASLGDISIENLIEDLNKIQPNKTFFPISPRWATSYLEDVGNFCQQAISSSQVSVFEEIFKKTLDVEDGAVAAATASAIVPHALASLNNAMASKQVIQWKARRRERLSQFIQNSNTDGLDSSLVASSTFLPLVGVPNLELIGVLKPINGRNFCEAVQKRIGSLKSAIKQEVAQKGQLSYKTKESYWELAQVVTERFFSRESQLGPMGNSSEKLNWISHSPTHPIYIPKGEAVLGRTIEEITRSLVAMVDQLKLGGVEQLVETAPLDANAKKGLLDKNDSDRVKAVLRLNRSQKRALFQSVMEISEGYLLEPNGEPSGLVPSRLIDLKTRTLDYEDWLKELDLLLGLWQTLRNDFRTLNRDFGKPVRGFQQLSESIFTHFVNHTPYRLKSSRLYIPNDQSSMEASLIQSLARFKFYRPIQRFRIVDQINSLVVSERARLVGEQLEKAQARAKEQKELGLEVDSTVEVKKVYPFKEGPLAFQARKEKALQVTPWLLFVSQYLKPSNDETPSINSARQWQAYYRMKDKQFELPYQSEFEDYRFEWRPLGKEGNEKQVISYWIDALEEDPHVQKQFQQLKKTSIGKNTSRLHLWHLFDSVSSFKKSKSYSELMRLVSLSDKNARAMPAAHTYPFFLAFVNWLTNRYGLIPDVKAIKDNNRQVIFGDTYQAGLLVDILKLLHLDPRDFDGWEDLMKRRSRPDDWEAIARVRLITLTTTPGDRRPQRTWLDVPQVAESERAYRPLPIRLDPLFEKSDKNAWLGGFSRNDRYLLHRVNQDDLDHRPVYQAFTSIQTQWIGEHEIRGGYGSQRESLKTNRDRWEAFGREHRLESRSTKTGQKNWTSIEDFIHYASLNRFSTTPDEVKAVAPIWQALSHFMQSANELVYEYPYENDGELSLVSDGAEQAQLMLAAFAKQKEIHWTGKIPKLSSEADALPQAIWEAMAMAKHRLTSGRSKEDQAHVLKLLKLLSQYYRLKMGGLVYIEGLKRIGENIRSGLEDYCSQRNLLQIRTKEQFEEKKQWFKKMQFEYIDGPLREHIREYAPGQGKNEALLFLQSLAREEIEHSAARKTADTVARWIIVIGILMMFFEGASWMRAALSKPITRLALFATSVFIGGYFGYTAWDEYQEDYYRGPARAAAAARMTQREVIGLFPLTSEQAMQAVDDVDQAFLRRQNSFWRWGFRIWTVLLSWQILGPSRQLLFGGTIKLMDCMAPRLVNAVRIRYYAWKVGISYSTIKNLTPQEQMAAILAAWEVKLAKAVGAQLGTYDLLIPIKDQVMLRYLKLDVETQLEAMAKELAYQYDPVTRTLRSVLTHSNARIAELREKLQPRLQRLLDMATRLNSSQPALLKEDFALLLANQGHASTRLLGRAWFFTGLPWWLNPSVARASYRLSGIWGIGGIQSSAEAVVALPKLLAQTGFHRWALKNQDLLNQLLIHFRQNVDPSMDMETLLLNMFNPRAPHHHYFLRAAQEGVEAEAIQASAVEIPLAMQGEEIRSLLDVAAGCVEEVQLLIQLAGLRAEEITLSFTRLIARHRWRRLIRQLQKPREPSTDLLGDENPRFPEELRNARMGNGPALGGFDTAEAVSAPKKIHRLIPESMPMTEKVVPNPLEFNEKFIEVVVGRAPEKLRPTVRELLELKLSSHFYENAYHHWRGLSKLPANVDEAALEAFEYVIPYCRARELRLDIWKTAEGETFRHFFMIRFSDSGQTVSPSFSMYNLGLASKPVRTPTYDQRLLGAMEGKPITGEWVAERSKVLLEVLGKVSAEESSELAILVRRWVTRITAAQKQLIKVPPPAPDPEKPFYLLAENEILLGALPDNPAKAKVPGGYSTETRKSVLSQCMQQDQTLVENLLREGVSAKDYQKAMEWWAGRTNISESAKKDILRAYRIVINTARYYEVNIVKPVLPRTGEVNPFELTVEEVGELGMKHYRALYQPDRKAMQDFEEARLLLAEVPEDASQVLIERTYHALKKALGDLPESEMKNIALKRIEAAARALKMDWRNESYFTDVFKKLLPDEGDIKILAETFAEEVLAEAANPADVIARLQAMRRKWLTSVATEEESQALLEFIDRFTVLIRTTHVMRFAEIHGIKDIKGLRKWMLEYTTTGHFQVTMDIQEAELILQTVSDRLGLTMGRANWKDPKTLTQFSQKIGELKPEAMSEEYFELVQRAYDVCLRFQMQEMEQAIIGMHSKYLPLPYEMILSSRVTGHHQFYRWYAAGEGHHVDLPITLFAEEAVFEEIGMNPELVLSALQGRNATHNLAQQDALKRGTHNGIKGIEVQPGPMDRLIDSLIYRQLRAVQSGQSEHAEHIRRALKRMGIDDGGTLGTQGNWYLPTPADLKKLGSPN